MAILIWLLIGLVAGALARLLVPGRQQMSVLMTMVLGLVGSLVGGFISSLVFNHPAGATLHPTGIIMSTVGAVVVLAIYLWAQKR